MPLAFLKIFWGFVNIVYYNTTSFTGDYSNSTPLELFIPTSINLRVLLGVIQIKLLRS